MPVSVEYPSAYSPSVCQRTGGSDPAPLPGSREFGWASVTALYLANCIKELWGPLTINSQYDQDEPRPANQG